MLAAHPHDKSQTLPGKMAQLRWDWRNLLLRLALFFSYFQWHSWRWTGGLAVASRSGKFSSRGRPRGSKNSKANELRAKVGPIPERSWRRAGSLRPTVKQRLTPGWRPDRHRVPKQLKALVYRYAKPPRLKLQVFDSAPFTGKWFLVIICIRVFPLLFRSGCKDLHNRTKETGGVRDAAKNSKVLPIISLHQVQDLLALIHSWFCVDCMSSWRRCSSRKQSRAGRKHPHKTGWRPRSSTR